MYLKSWCKKTNKDHILIVIFSITLFTIWFFFFKTIQHNRENNHKKKQQSVKRFTYLPSTKFSTNYYSSTHRSFISRQILIELNEKERGFPPFTIYWRIAFIQSSNFFYFLFFIFGVVSHSLTVSAWALNCWALFCLFIFVSNKIKFVVLRLKIN